MSSRSSPREPEAWFVRALRTAALTAVVAGAAASLGLMVRAGSRQRSIVLILLFGMLSGFIHQTKAVFDEVRAFNLSVTGAFVGRYATIQSPSAERAAAAPSPPSVRTL